jgi:hypothetical protein
MGRAQVTLAVLALTLLVSVGRPAPAAALNPCKVIGGFSPVIGKGCTGVTNIGRAVSAGKKLLTGHIGGAIKTLAGASATAAKTASTALALAAVAAWVMGGAQFALKETSTLISATTDPQLGGAWFKSEYWHVAGIAALLTLPLLFAAAIQALIRSDMAMLMRAVFGYMPLSLLAVGVAAPLVTLALSATDEMSAAVSAAAGNPGGGLLTVAGGVAGLGSLLHQSLFMTFLVGTIVAGGALVLWFELLIRDAAVYVVVLMLPLTFAAMVWPARRVWTTRALEALTALIISKFAIVAVLSLGAEALRHGSPVAWLAGAALIVLGAFTPWAVLRFVPIAEAATGALAAVRGDVFSTGTLIGGVSGAAALMSAERAAAAEVARDVPGEMRSDAEAVSEAQAGGGGAATASGAIDLLLPGDPSAASAGEPPDVAMPRADGGAEPPGAGGASAVPGAQTPAGTAAGARDRVGGDGSPASPAERFPGAPPNWQADDLSWQPLVIGYGDGAPQILSEPSDPPAPAPDPPAPDPPAPAPVRDAPGGDAAPDPPARPAASPPAVPQVTPGDEGPPLPESQEPAGGRL